MHLLPGEAGKAPDVLVRIFRLHAPQEGQQRALVLRLHRLPAKQGKAADIAGRQQLQHLLLGFRREGLTEGKIPRLRLKAVFAVVRTAGDEQRHAHAKAVGDVAVFDLAIVHGK